jgi:hypothetical protein
MARKSTKRKPKPKVEHPADAPTYRRNNSLVLLSPNHGKHHRDLKSEYTIQSLLNRIEGGRFLADVTQDEDMPHHVTVLKWCEDDPQFRQRLARSREIGNDRIAVDAIKIADDGRNDTYIDAKGNQRVDYDVLGRSKLRVDTRFKLLALTDPRYSERTLQLQRDDEERNREIDDDETARRIAGILQDAMDRKRLAERDKK